MEQTPFMYLQQDVVSNDETLKKYVNVLNTHLHNTSDKTFRNLLDNANKLCSNLPSYTELCDEFKTYKGRDKGIAGKIFERGIFGQKPNSDSNTDFSERDLKVTTFKRLRNGNMNAKERLTITNCGDTQNYDTFSDISNSEDVKSSKFYKKICKGLLVVLEHNKSNKYKSFEDVMNSNVIFIVCYDIEQTIPNEWFMEICNDYKIVKNLVLEKKVSVV